MKYLMRIISYSPYKYPFISRCSYPYKRVAPRILTYSFKSTNLIACRIENLKLVVGVKYTTSTRNSCLSLLIFGEG